MPSYSNYNAELAHIAAPGRVLSADISNAQDYSEKEGTSMATPHVAGTMALLRELHPDEPASFIISRLLNSVTLLPSLENRCLSEGRLNMYRALTGATNAPENDLFTNASTMNDEGGRISGSLNKASSEPNEPSQSALSRGTTTWHKWIPNRDGNALVTLTPNGFAPSVSVYEGQSIETINHISSASSIGQGDRFMVSFAFSNQNEYYIQIDSLSSEQGPYSLELSIAAENDRFADAFKFSEANFRKAGTNKVASGEPSENPIHPSAAGASVWYEWTAPSSGDFYLRLSKTSGRMFACIFKGDSLSLITPIDTQFEENSQTNQLFLAEAGVSYKIAVDSLSSTGSDFIIEGDYLTEPKIMVQPKDKTVTLGSRSSFSVSVYSVGTPEYQWLKDGVEIADSTESILNLSNIGESDLGMYQVRIHIGDYTLYSREAALSSGVAGTFILQQPTAQSLKSGETISLNAFVVSTAETISYQWLKDDIELPTENAPTLRIENATPTNNGFYQLRIDQGLSSQLTNAAYVLVSSDSQYESFAWPSVGKSLIWPQKVEVIGDYYVAYTDYRIGFSLDGLAWQYSQIAATSIVQGNGYYLASSSEGIFRSPDLSRWERIYETNDQIRSIAFGEGLFVARTQSGLYYSIDGSQWTLGLETPFEYDGMVTYGNGRFVANSNGRLYVSEDGKFWDSIQSPINEWRLIQYADGLWWLYAPTESEQIYSSADLENWDTVDLPVKSMGTMFFDPIDDKAYLFTNSIAYPEQYSSPISIDLYRHAAGSFTFLKNINIDHHPNRVTAAAKNGKVMLVDNRGPLFLEEYTKPNGSQRLEGWWHQATLSYANEQFIASKDKELRSSRDGTNWQLEATTLEDYGSFVHGNGIYVGSNHFGNSLNTLGAHGSRFGSVAFGEGVFVGVNGTGVFSSTDGRTWTSTLSGVGTIARVAYGNGAFVAYYDSNIFFSTNGTSWTKSNTPEELRLEFVVYGNNQFMAFYSGRCYTSINGDTWTPRGEIVIPGRSSSTVNHMFYFDDRFVIEYWDEFYYESIDGTTWTEMNISPFELRISSRPKYAFNDSSLLISSEMGIGIVGHTEPDNLITVVSSPANQLTAHIGNPIEIEFRAYSATTPISEIEIFVNGALKETLYSNQTSFTYTPETEGTAEIQIVSHNQDGDQASDSLSVSAIPFIYTELPIEEFWLHSLVYYNGAFYGGGDGGRIFVSKNGIGWKGIQTPSINQIAYIVANENGIVAGPTDNGILYSQDGINWLEIGGFHAVAIHLDGDLFVTGTDENPVISKDGKNWFSGLSGKSITGANASAGQGPVVFNGFEFKSYLGGPGFQATVLQNIRKVYQIGDAYVGHYANELFYSKDLATWTPISLEDTYVSVLEMVNGLLFVIENNEIVYVSGDGIEWLAPNTIATKNKISFSEGYFYSVQHVEQGSPELSIMRSQNGLEWEKFGNPIETDAHGYKIEHLIATPIGVAMISNDNDYSFHSENETISRTGTDPHGSRDEIKIIGKTPLLALSDGGSYKRQPDNHWYRTEVGIYPETVYANGIYFAESNDGPIRSVDSIVWEDVAFPDWMPTLGDSPRIERIFTEGDKAIWIDVRYSVEGWYFNVFGRSTDGIIWERVPTSEEIADLNELFVFKDHTYARRWNYIYRMSNNYSEWSNVYTSTDQQVDSDLGSVATTTLLIAALRHTNSNSSIDISTDGDTWKNYPIPNVGFAELRSTEDALFLIGDSIWKSENGQDWTEHIPYNIGATSNGKEIVFFTDNLTFVERVDTDIAIDHASVLSKDYAVGDTLSLSLTLKNNSLEPINFSNDSVIDYLFSRETSRWSLAPDEPGFSDYITIPFSSLAAGESRSFQIETQIPESVEPGQYFFSAAIDYDLIPKDGNPSNDFFFDTVSMPINIPSRSLHIGAAENGFVLGAEGKTEFALNDKLLLRAVPDFGYEFSEWEGDLSSLDETLLVTMDNDISLTPSFSKRTYNLEIETIGKGSVSVEQENTSFKFGDEINLEAIPEEGWIFLDWIGYGQNSSSTLNAMVGRDLHVSARFGYEYSSWASSHYGEDPESSDPHSTFEGTSYTNMEYFALGLEFPHQRSVSELGFRRIGNTLIFRYSVFKGLYDFAVTPTWSTDLLEWSNNSNSAIQIGETEDLLIYEVSVPILDVAQLSSLALKIEAIEPSEQ